MSLIAATLMFSNPVTLLLIIALILCICALIPWTGNYYLAVVALLLVIVSLFIGRPVP